MLLIDGEGGSDYPLLGMGLAMVDAAARAMALRPARHLARFDIPPDQGGEVGFLHFKISLMINQA
jgi:hypothetical protein